MKEPTTRGPWPKQVPELSEHQREIRDDFMRFWHEVLPKKYGLVERFNHGYPIRFAAPRQRTLEIGAGLGEHLRYENLKEQTYFALELREEMAAIIRRDFHSVRTIVADCQERLPFTDAYFDRVLAIHVLEHLPDLPATVREVFRVLKPRGRFCVCIPCEGGAAYSAARAISAKRIFERRYALSYDWFIRSEHLNTPHEILEELKRTFRVVHMRYFPARVPSVNLNLVIGLTLEPESDVMLCHEGGRV